MSANLTASLMDTVSRLEPRAFLLLPLLLALAIAWGDLRTRRIPNYLTLGAALAGLGFRLGCYGWAGVADGFLGLALGFGLLLLPYLMGGTGAGDVKALAALGAWLGPLPTFYLFLYMAIAGGLVALAVLAWKGLLWARIRRGWARVAGMMFPGSAFPYPEALPRIEGIPYGVPMALGMLMLFVKGV